MVRRGPASVYRLGSRSRLTPRIALTGSALRHACRMMIRLFSQSTERWYAIIPSGCVRPTRHWLVGDRPTRRPLPFSGRRWGARPTAAVGQTSSDAVVTAELFTGGSEPPRRRQLSCVRCGSRCAVLVAIRQPPTAGAPRCSFGQAAARSRAAAFYLVLAFLPAGRARQCRYNKLVWLCRHCGTGQRDRCWP